MTTRVHEPPNELLRIDALYAFVSVDDKGHEGLCGAYIDGKWMPLIAADEKRLASLTLIAEDLARRTKQTIKLIKLTTREELRVIGPPLS